MPAGAGLVSGVIGGLVVSLLSKSPLSVSGPAAGLTALTLSAVQQLGDLRLFFAAVAVAGLIQLLLGLIRAGGFTWLVPSSVIKGMLAAIGILLVSKQVPLLIGYDRPDFWNKELINVFTFSHGFEQVSDLSRHVSMPVILLSGVSMAVLVGWKKWFSGRLPFIPASFVAVLAAVGVTVLFGLLPDGWAMGPDHFIRLKEEMPFSLWCTAPDSWSAWRNTTVWHYGLLMGLIASLETLLSIEAVDKLDPLNRITPRNRELAAQGVGNILSGLLGGLPVTAVIVRSSANAEAGARTRMASFVHGLLLLVAMAFAIPAINRIPYCVLAVLLVRTGVNLAKPSMIRSVYRQGREQFLPFLVTAVAILSTDLLTGVGIGLVYALYFLIKHTFRAGYSVQEVPEGHATRYRIELAMNVSFLNKKRLAEKLDAIPPYSVVEISGERSIYVDHDILEIVHDFRAKAGRKHIQLLLHGVKDAETIELHG